jgi:methyl-accepting chemotaxis protein WspA
VTQGMNTQADGAQQINSAMIQLTDAARSTSTSIGAFNQATSDLRDAVGGLRVEVTKFKVEKS